VAATLASILVFFWCLVLSVNWKMGSVLAVGKFMDLHLCESRVGAFQTICHPFRTSTCKSAKFRPPL
jgi:hypothetical protein